MKYLDGTRDAAARLLSRPRLAELLAILARPPSAGPMRPHFSANRHPKIDASRPKRKLHAYNTVPLDFVTITADARLYRVSPAFPDVPG